MASLKEQFLVAQSGSGEIFGKIKVSTAAVLAFFANAPASISSQFRASTLDYIDEPGYMGNVATSTTQSTPLSGLPVCPNGVYLRNLDTTAANIIWLSPVTGFTAGDGSCFPIMPGEPAIWIPASVAKMLFARAAAGTPKLVWWGA